MQMKRIYIPIYYITIYIHIGDKKTAFKKLDCMELYEPECEKNAGSFISNERNVCVMLAPYADIDTVAHEAYHVLCYIKQWHNINCEEAEACLLGYLVKTIAKVKLDYDILRTKEIEKAGLK